MYYLYILSCADKTLYTGIATDVVRRVREHNESSRGAKYTRGRRPVKLVYTASFRNRSAAQKEEVRVKRLTRIEKLKMIKGRTRQKIKQPSCWRIALGCNTLKVYGKL